MKIVSSLQMQVLEAQAYRDGASADDFMEEAGSGIALVVHDYVKIIHSIIRSIWYAEKATMQEMLMLPVCIYSISNMMS